MARRFGWLSILAALSAFTPAARAADPHPSWGALPVGNGWGVAIWDVAAGRPNGLHEHVYRFESPGVETRDVLWDTYFGLRVDDGPGQWLTDVPPDDVRYLDGSGIVVLTQSVGALSVETYLFAPWGLETPAVALLMRVVGAPGVSAQGVEVTAYGLHNVHLGDGRPDPGTNDEEIVWDEASTSFGETGPAGAVVVVPLSAPSHHACTPQNPFVAGTAGQDLVDTDGSGVVDDAVSGLQWDLGRLREGDSAWVGFVLGFDRAGDVAELRGRIAAAIGGRDARTLLTVERAGWEAFLGPVPADFDDLALATRLGLAVLRMAQVREPGRGHGQIVASLPPGQWNIAWVRDMAYAIVGLAEAGRAVESRDALSFLLDAEAGAYEEEVGEPYRLSVTRYFGDGTEESDENSDGPNVELDGWGLFLWAARHHVDAADDTAWLDERWDDVREGVAEVLARRIDDTGLVQADSSIWEVHWNGRQRHFAYTSLAAARGLCDASALAARVGDGASEESFRETARALGATIAAALVGPDGSLGASLEDVEAGEGYRDAAVVEALGWRIVTPGSDLARATLDGLNDLEIPDGVGYFRNDDGGEYDSAEWIFVDLRAVVAFESRGLAPSAQRLVEWVTAQAGENYGLLPELYDRETADYAGAVPMAGFGGAAVRLAVAGIEEDDSCFDQIIDPERDGGVADAGVDAGPGDEPAGCACRVGGGEPGRGGQESGVVLLLWVMAGIVWARRRDLMAAGLGFLLVLGGCAEEKPRAADAAPEDAGIDAPVDDEPVPCEVTIRYRPDGATPGRVVVAGQWNGWSLDLDPLSDGDGDGTFERLVELLSGRYAYKLVVDGTWTLDPGNSVTMFHEGTENSRLDVADCRLPRLEVESAVASADGRMQAVLRYVDGVRGAGLDPDSIQLAIDGAEIEAPLASDRLTIDEPGNSPGKHTLRARANDQDGRAAGEVVVPFWIETEPFTWQDALLYFVFTDRFRDGDRARNGSVEGVQPPANYGGGDLARVRDAIEDGTVDALGVRALWLSPVEAGPDRSELGSDGRAYSGYHGYWPAAPRSVDPHFGDEATLREVVDAAHRRGIRVLLDLVLNHVHTLHPYVAERAAEGWFHGDGSCVCETCGWDTHAVDCWFTPYLPDFDYTNTDAVDRVVDDAVFWVREVGVDGFRVDAVKHVETVVVRTLVDRLRAYEHAGIDHYLVGETFTGEDGRGQIAAFVGPGLLDGQFDFPLHWPVVRTLLRREASLRELDTAVLANDGAYPAGTVMAPFLGNHDVPRAISHAAGQIADAWGNGSKEQGWSDPPAAPTDARAYERLAVAFTFLFTQPGAPLLYYGDEVGLAGAGDPDNRRMMPAEESLTVLQRTLRDTVRALGTLRRDLPGLRRGPRRTLWIDDEVYVWVRGEGADAVVVAINAEDAERTVDVPLPGDLGIANGTSFDDRLGGAGVSAAGGALHVTLAPRTGAIWAR
jgi:MYXO-CTERM domain-containing protein